MWRSFVVLSPPLSCFQQTPSGGSPPRSSSRHTSSILDDESRASVNSQLADAVTCSPCPGPDGKGVFTAFANLIEVDNVCDSGGKLYNALRTKVP